MSAVRFDSAATAAALADFYCAGEPGSDDAYLQRKQSLSSGRRELAEAWHKVRCALDGANCVLDWGCRHGVFAWLARQELGADAELHGCDICAAGQYADFHRSSGLDYRQLDHPWLLPYPDDCFDVVLAGGALEHVPNDGESLTELWRVLKPGGRLVLTHLPNAASISEWMSRRFWPQQAHLRRYRIVTMRRRLLDRGLLPLRWGYHHLIPATLPGADRRPRLARSLETLYRISPVLERLWPLNRLSATLWIVAEKRAGL